MVYLPLEEIKLFHVDGVTVSVDGQDNRQTNGGFGSGNGQNKDSKNLTLNFAWVEEIGKAHEIEVDGI